MIVNSRKNLTHPTFIASSLILLVIFYIRITRGLDLTDEMQYYGQIKGLVESGKLFSNDLFIQQLVYVLFYPAFYLHHLFFGFEGLIFFGRLLMMVLSAGIFFYAYQKLVRLDFSTTVASLTSLSLTFAVTSCGPFALNYNTVSQVLWIIFMVRFFEWSPLTSASWAPIPIITAFAHPTSAVAMSLLILVRLLVEHKYNEFVKVFIVFLGGAIITAPIAFHFATLQEYLTALEFSSGFGVGKVFFSSPSQQIFLMIIYTMFGTCFLFSRQLNRINIEFLAIIFITSAIILFGTGLTGGACAPLNVAILSFLNVFVYGWALSNSSETDTKLKQRINWLVGGLLLYATTLGVTSGNGISRMASTFMVGLPLLLGIAVSTMPNKKHLNNLTFSKITCVILICILFAVQWSRHPYRDGSWWQANQSIQSVPEFKFINLSPEKTRFIQRIQQALRPITQGKRTLIISEYPGLYFALGAHAETCMLYMHTLQTDKSEDALFNCLNNKKPEVFIDVHLSENTVPMGRLGFNPHWRMKNVMRMFYSRRGFNCINDSINLRPIKKSSEIIDHHIPKKLKYSLCT
jgi:hypothetical protein